MDDVLHVPIKLKGDMAETLYQWESFTPILNRVISRLETLPVTGEDCLTLELKILGTTLESIYAQVQAHYAQQRRFEWGLDIVAQVAAEQSAEDRESMNLVLSHILDVVDVRFTTRKKVEALVKNGLSAMGLGQKSSGPSM